MDFSNQFQSIMMCYASITLQLEIPVTSAHITQLQTLGVEEGQNKLINQDIKMGWGIDYP